MAVYSDREAFIPYRRSDLISLCLEDGELKSTDVLKFRSFCELLSAYYHFQFHSFLEKLKDNYVPFNPDADTKFISELTPHQQAEMAHQLVTDFQTLLEKANYVPLSPASLQRAFKKSHCLNSIRRSILTTLTVWSATAEVTTIKSLRLRSSSGRSNKRWMFLSG